MFGRVLAHMLGDVAWVNSGQARSGVLSEVGATRARSCAAWSRRAATERVAAAVRPHPLAPRAQARERAAYTDAAALARAAMVFFFAS